MSESDQPLQDNNQDSERVPKHRRKGLVIGSGLTVALVAAAVAASGGNKNANTPITPQLPTPTATAETPFATPTPGPYDQSREEVERDPSVSPGGNKAGLPLGAPGRIPDSLQNLLDK